MNKENLIKFLTVILFLGFISIFPIINILTPDKTVSTLENKVLTQMPTISLNKIKSGYFMRTFDEYTSDQFPFRKEFISIKNNISYLFGVREFRNIYVTKNHRLLEKFIFNKTNIDKNISQVNTIIDKLQNEYNINTKIMVIPTSIAFYDDELPSFTITDNQELALNYLKSKIHSFYTPFNILNENKNEYIYFNTDHHWTQLGAKLAYNDLYNIKEDVNTTLNNYEEVAKDFFGTYYSKAILPTIKGDKIYAYKNYNNFKMEMDLSLNYNTLYGEDKLNGKNKYQYFLHGDPAYALIEGNKESKEEILILKDSFAHNFIPFLTINYKKIHVIDPRYYTINLDDYLKENPDITDALFINNIQTLNDDVFYK
ncbi:MAG: DHHW family protein [Peptostreptococcaceae bacterium]